MNLPKVYEPNQYEEDVYKLWEASGSFEPKERGNKDNYCIVMPPPNANGNLHLGHALTAAIQDILIRYHRLLGKKTLYLPGADHAGFETWVVYEKKLNEEGKTRFDFSREELFDQVWDFVEQNKGNMLKQTRQLGASCDWSRFTYTLDEKVVKTTYKTFQRLWDDGLVYRGERIVNYCTTHDTSFSDIEVQFKEEKSKLWHIDYELTDGSKGITVATTRPETMLGDTAVAVHPEDKRYKELIGKTITLPLTNREIPIVADKAVEKEFGSGAVKVTPAHDQTDFEIGERHSLPEISVIGYDGKMTRHAPKKYTGMTVKEARQAVLNDLKASGALAKEEDYVHMVGHCYKCGTVIEPLLKDQWFIRMEPLALQAKKAIEKEQIKFVPASKKGVVLRYLDEIRDWNISRQIAWGIPIPAFRNVDEPDQWIFDERVDQESIEVDGRIYHRDSDVFDTWFSSGQWPFSTLGYPDGKDHKDFYPNSVMETGYDILIQWVTRMIMLGIYITGDVPFKDVYLHGLILDEKGQKMSKSKGNVINPIEVLEEYGSDALRMGLISGRSAGLNQAFTIDKVVGARNFANKLWNVARYIEGVVGDDYKKPKLPEAKSSADHWILEKLNDGGKEVGKLLDNYRFSEAYEAIYRLLWDDFADWYIEASKIETNNSVLAYGLETLLKLAHPIAPFVTETIWETLKWEDSLLITSSWPSRVDVDSKEAQNFEKVKAVIAEIRYLRTELSLRQSTLYHRGNKFIEDNQDFIVRLAGLVGCSVVDSGYGLRLTQSNVDAWIDVEKNIIHEYFEKITAKQEQLKLRQSNLEKRLKNKGYTKSAPKHLVEATKTELEEVKSGLGRLAKELQSIQESLHE